MVTNAWTNINYSIEFIDCNAIEIMQCLTEILDYDDISHGEIDYKSITYI